EITGVQIGKFRFLPIVAIGLSDSGRDYINRSKLMNKVAKAGEDRFGPGDLTITQHMIGMPIDMFYVLLLAYASEHGDQPWAREQLAEVQELSDEGHVP
ncbi:MAG: hypothetical protein Q4G26_12195, partial [Paracoccus sp. (in: a-proteobacteria)]|nr:hypothetical protein [Paracoccus sp. (in: a-proteobacteria)]